MPEYTCVQVEADENKRIVWDTVDTNSLDKAKAIVDSWIANGFTASYFYDANINLD